MSVPLARPVAAGCGEQERTAKDRPVPTGIAAHRLRQVSARVAEAGRSAVQPFAPGEQQGTEQEREVASHAAEAEANECRN